MNCSCNCKAKGRSRGQNLSFFGPETRPRRIISCSCWSYINTLTDEEDISQQQPPIQSFRSHCKPAARANSSRRAELGELQDMEDLAASLMPHSHSAPLYLLYDLSASFPKQHGLPPLVHDDDDGDDGFEFATAADRGGGAAALRACASDVSAAAFADELLRAGALLPLSLPPRLQRPSYSAGASAAASPTSSAAAALATRGGGRKHRGFDPFAAALEKVRRDGPSAKPRRARSLSPLRASAADASSAHKKHASKSRAPRPAPPVAARRARRGVRHLLCRVVMAGAAVAPKALWPRRKDGVPYRPGLLVCLGYGV